MFFFIVRTSKDSVLYIFEVLLKKEMDEYLDKKYYRVYVHINKIISHVKKEENKGKIIIDIGGSTGKTAILFSQAFPENQVYVFEPLALSFTILEDSVRDYPNILPRKTAIGNFTGISKINIVEGLSSSSLLSVNPVYSDHPLGQVLKSTGIEEIPIDSLDNLFPDQNDIMLIKIDVQGYELEVLKGGKKVISKTGWILLEVSNHEGYINSPHYYEIDDFMRNSGFLIFDIFPAIHNNGRLTEWDVIYKKT